MKSRLSPLALIVALLLAFGVIAVACDGSSGGGGEPLTLDEYFEQMEAIIASADETFAQIETESEQKFEEAQSEEEALGVLGDFFTALVPVLEEFSSDFRDLGPPAEVEDARNEMLEAFDDFLTSAASVIDGIEGVESEDDFDALLEDSGFNAADDRLDAACLVLQEIADENSIDVDLDCGDGEEL